MTLLVTGGTGFLGRHLLGALQRAHPDEPIWVMVRARHSWESQAWAQALRHVQVIEAPLQDPQRSSGGLPVGKLRGIFHLAAMVRHSRVHGAEVFATNVEGTCAMVQLAAAHRCRLVFVSTSGTVACSKDAAATPAEDAPWCEREVSAWPYYASKIAAEKAAQALSARLGVDLVTLRPPIMLGPGDHRLRATGHMLRFLRGRLPFLLHGGIHYVDIRDAAAAMVAAMDHARPQPIYHLPGVACSIRQFFTDVSKLAQKRVPKLSLPYKAAWHLAQADAWLGQRIRGRPLGLLPDPVVIEMAAHFWNMTSHHAKADLSFAPRLGEQTLQDTLAWLQPYV